MLTDFLRSHVVLPKRVRDALHAHASIRKVLIGLLTFAILLFASTWLAQSPPGQVISLGIQDFLQRIGAERRPDNVFILGITENEYASPDWFGARTPLDPLVLRRVIEAALSHRPAVLAIDLDTSNPIYSGFLDGVELGMTKVVWARTIQQRGSELEVTPVAGRTEVEPPYSGIASALPGPDGVVRTFSQAFDVRSRSVKGLPAAITDAYCLSTFCPPSAQSLQKGEIAHRFRLNAGGRVIELPRLVRLESGEPPTVLTGKIAILGELNSRFDRHMTPVGPLYGVEVIAEIVESELTGDIIRSIDPTLYWVIKIFVGLAIILINRVLWPIAAMLTSTITLAMLGLLLTTAGFLSGAFWLGFSTFVFAILLEQVLKSAEVAQEALAHLLPDK
jgi:CHASE2 domain-containing sensor protein